MTAIDDTVSIKQVRCGYDGTMFLTDTGALLACGRFVAVICIFFSFSICILTKHIDFHAALNQPWRALAFVPLLTLSHLTKIGIIYTQVQLPFMNHSARQSLGRVLNQVYRTSWVNVCFYFSSSETAMQTTSWD